MVEKYVRETASEECEYIRIRCACIEKKIYQYTYTAA